MTKVRVEKCVNPVPCSEIQKVKSHLCSWPLQKETSPRQPYFRKRAQHLYSGKNKADSRHPPESAKSWFKPISASAWYDSLSDCSRDAKWRKWISESESIHQFQYNHSFNQIVSLANVAECAPPRQPSFSWTFGAFEISACPTFRHQNQELIAASFCSLLAAS